MILYFLQDPREALIVSLKREVKILEQENSHLHKLLELAEYDSTTTAAIAGSAAPGNIPNQIMNGDGGRGVFKLILITLALFSKNLCLLTLR